MRIIGGKYKGRQLKTPGNLPVRPTTNSAKESLFNIISNRFDFEDLRVLDLFSGTGNIAFEFISRGVSSLTAVDSNLQCIKHLHNTIRLLQIENMDVIKTDVFKYLTGAAGRYDIIFADPPFEMQNLELLPQMIFDAGVLNPGGWFILEHEPRKNFEQHPAFEQHRKYGHVNFSIFAAS